MILACCPNPALDVTYTVTELRPGESNRVSEVTVRAGGKGTNVARVLGRLGSPATLLAPLGGTAGAQFEAELVDATFARAFVPIDAATRRTVTVLAGSSATVLNEPGPTVTPMEWSAFTDRFVALVAESAIALISGSSPLGVATDGYADLTRLAVDRGATVILDAEGPLLAAALAARPTLVKVNALEAGSILGAAVDDPFAAGAELVRRGAGGAIISLGADGVAATVAGRRFRARLTQQVAGNPTGAGDALAAALAHGLAAGAPWEQVLAEAVAVSAAAVAVAHAGDYDPDLAGALRPGVIVEEC